MKRALLLLAACGAPAVVAPPPANEGGEVAPTLHGVTAVATIERADLEVTGDFGPFDDVAVVITPSDTSDRTCSIALHLGHHWYVTAPSEDVCIESGYIELEGASSATVADGVIAVELAIQWHTNDYVAGASYALTTICGVGHGELACLPTFVSECEQGAPAADCDERAHERSFQIGDDGTLTIDGQPPQPLFE